MNTAQKISPFQITCILVCGRLFTIITWTQRGAPQAGSLLAGQLLGTVVQFFVALLLVRLLDFPGNAAQPRWYFRPLLGLCWLVCLATAAATAGSTAGFLAACYYQDKRGLLMLALLVGAAIFTAWWGLHGFMRTAPLAAVLSLAGLAALLAGALPAMHISYLPPMTLSWQGTAHSALYSLLTNAELVLLPLLAAHATKPLKKRAIAIWLGGSWAVAAGLSLAVMAALGYYAQQRQYPVYELARVARLLTERLDTILMGLWVLLGFLRTSVVLWLSWDIWGRLVCPIKRLRQPVLHGAVVLLAATVLLFTGCSSSGSLSQKTLVTLLELTPVPQGCLLRVEYLDMTQGKDKKQYLSCEVEGTSLDDCLNQLEKDYSRSFYLKGCGGVAVAAQVDTATLHTLLEQLDALGELRPMAQLVLASQPVLEAGVAVETSAADALRGMFAVKGGKLDGGYTLKDGIARLRDPRQTLVLPEISKKDKQPVVIGYRFFE